MSGGYHATEDFHRFEACLITICAIREAVDYDIDLELTAIPPTFRIG